MSNKLVIIGAGGHGKVVADIAAKSGYEIVGFLDENPTIGTCCGYPILGGVEQIVRYRDECCFVIAIGSNEARCAIAAQYDVEWTTLIHPAAVVGAGVTIGVGTVVMATAVISPAATVGAHCIINTGAVVEHDSCVGNFVHIAPKVALGGTVCVGDGSQIGIGACVKNNITITENVQVGAGAAVIHSIEESGTYAGVPARRIR